MRLIAAFAALSFCGAAVAQTQTAPPRAPKVAKKVDLSDFQIVGWTSLEPQDGGLIRSPASLAKIDLSAKESDDTNITVYAHKKRPDVGPRDPGGFQPAGNAAALPSDIHYLPPGHCANGAYNTVAGQPANGQDLIGFLGSGDGC